MSNFSYKELYEKLLETLWQNEGEFAKDFILTFLDELDIWDMKLDEILFLKFSDLCDYCNGGIIESTIDISYDRDGIELSWKEAYNIYLNSESWKDKRNKVLEKCDHKCQLCSKAEKLNVHHNNYKRIGVEKPTDLIALCNKCHKKFHNIK